MLARLDALKPHLSTESREATQADVHRAALVAGIVELEKRYKALRAGSMADPMKGEKK